MKTNNYTYDEIQSFAANAPLEDRIDFAYRLSQDMSHAARQDMHVRAMCESGDAKKWLRSATDEQLRCVICALTGATPY